MKKFMIRFRGVRGSFPVPGVDTLKIGGNTSCVEFRIGNAIVIIDAGTGIISLGEDLLKEHFSTGKPVVATLLFSHMHHDHNQGFSFFKPAYLGSSILYMFGPTMFEKSMEEMLSQVMRPPFSPVRLEDLNSQRFLYNLRGPEEILIDPETGKAFSRNIHHEPPIPNKDMIRIFVQKDYAHPVNGVLFYRVEWQGKKVVYASDTEGYVGGNQKLIKFAKDADVLIHDAQYYMDNEYADIATSKQGYGHSSPEMAVEVARKANARQLVLYHHDPSHNDQKIKEKEKDVQKLFPNTIAAYEGLVIHLMAQEAA
jgi:phosphoribosyl 1,2-cyclic phosphodiesterase